MRTTSSPRTGLAALAVVAGLTLAGCGTDPQTTAADPVDTPTATGAGTGTGSPSPSDPPTSSDSPSTPSAGTTPDSDAVPVYFVGDTPDGPRLFREFHSVSGSDRLGAAAALLVTGQTLDPDYRTLLPDGMHITSVVLSDGKILVEVGADSQISADKSVSPDDARLAVQQLVYTLQGVAQNRYPVQVVQSDGGSEVPVPLLGVDTTKGVDAAPELDTLALVNVTEPEQGSSVSGTLAASGVASSFEANVPWEIRAGGADGKVVKSGAATAEGYVDKLYPWSTDIDVSDLPAGDYTFIASTDEPSGKEGSGATSDSKDFTIG